jgi:hypothetical protein
MEQRERANLLSVQLVKAMETSFQMSDLNENWNEGHVTGVRYAVTNVAV